MMGGGGGGGGGGESSAEWVYNLIGFYIHDNVCG